MYLSHHLRRSCTKQANAFAQPATVRLIWAFTLVAAAVIAFDIVPWLRGDAPWVPDTGQWVWPYEAPHWAWLVPAGAGLAIYVTGATLLLQRMQTGRRYPVPLMLWAFGGLVLLTLLLMCLENSPLFLLLARLTTQGRFHAASAEVTSLDHTLRHWPDFTAWLLAETSRSNGVVLSPPGITTVYYALTQGLELIPPVAGWGVRGAACRFPKISFGAIHEGYPSPYPVLAVHPGFCGCAGYGCRAHLAR